MAFLQRPIYLSTLVILMPLNTSEKVSSISETQQPAAVSDQLERSKALLAASLYRAVAGTLPQASVSYEFYLLGRSGSLKVARLVAVVMHRFCVHTRAPCGCLL